MAEWLDPQLPLVIARTLAHAPANRQMLPRATVEVCEPNTTYERNLYAPIDDARLSQPVLTWPRPASNIASNIRSSVSAPDNARNPRERAD